MKKLLFAYLLITAMAAGIAGCSTETAGHRMSPSHDAKTSAGQIPETSFPAMSAPGLPAGTDGADPVQATSAGADPVQAAQKVTIPTLTVTYGPDKEKLPSSSSGYQLNNTADDGAMESVIACGAEPLSYLVETVSPLPYVKLGTGLYLDFSEGTIPDAITVQDIILKEDGSSKYNDRSVKEFLLTCSGSTASFSLEANPAAMLSSDRSTYEEGGVIRGFRVNCTWSNGSTAEYGFVLRTDASD